MTTMRRLAFLVLGLAAVGNAFSFSAISHRTSSCCALHATRPEKPPEFSVLDDDGNPIMEDSNKPPFEFQTGKTNKQASSPLSVDPNDSMVVQDASIRQQQDQEEVRSKPVKRRPIRIRKRKAIDSFYDKEDEEKESFGRQSSTPKQEQEEPPSWMSRNQKFESTYSEENANAAASSSFEGTRVFVQNIPPHISWQDLKDHCKAVVGNVVYASVSRNGKGHGLVQYETAEEAQLAIRILRDHPLDGARLYARLDVQEAAQRERNKQKSSKIPAVWKCANPETAVVQLANQYVSMDQVEELVQRRDQARRHLDYKQSDMIRETLKMQYQVAVDDKLKLWWTITSTTNDGRRRQPPPKSIADAKGNGRWKKKQLPPWRQIPTNPASDALVDADQVAHLLSLRDEARAVKDFATADGLLDRVRQLPDEGLTLRIMDDARTWRVWTEEKPSFESQQWYNQVEGQESKSSSHHPEDFYASSPPRKELDPEEARQHAAKECMALVETHEPAKADEIAKVLEKFPGREFQVLKKLKKRYV